MIRFRLSFALSALTFLLVNSAYCDSTLLSKVKTALSSCNIDAYFKIKPSISDASPSERDDVARYFIERVKAKSQCDSYEALLGIEELVADRAGFALPDLTQMAIFASQQADILNGPHPRLDPLISAIHQVYWANPESRERYLEALTASGTPEQQLVLISAVTPSSVNLDSQTGEKMRKLWHEAMALTDAQVKTSKYSRYLKEGRVELAKLTPDIFQTAPVDEEVATINASSDTELQMPLIQALTDQPNANALQKINPQHLNPTQQLVLYSSQNSDAAKASLLALRKSYKLASTDSCKMGNTVFQIERTAPTDQSASETFFPEEEATYWIKTKDQVYPLVGTWNISSGPTGIVQAKKGQKTICKGLAAFAKGSVLILPVLADDRPFGDKLTIVLYDFEKMKVLDIIYPGAAEIAPHQPVTEDKDGYIFTIKLQPSDSANETKIKVRDKIADEVLDGILDTVYRLDLNSHDWKIHVDIDQTWKKFPYRQFFSNKEEFSKVFQLSGEQSRDSQNLDPIQWVRVAVKTGTAFCIYPSRTRNRPEADESWICTK